MIGIESAMPEGMPVAAPAITTDKAGGVSRDASTDQETTTSDAPDTQFEAKPSLSGKPPAKFAGTKSATPADAVATPAYQPNFKFKVLDKEREMDDWAKSVIKDQDTEKKVKELYEKAYGLDSVKQDRETLRSELSQAKEKISSTDKAIELISEYARTKDWDSFFESLSIPKNEVLQYALALVQREQMPPEQRAQWEASRQTQQQARYYQEQNQQLQASQQQFQVQQREFELSQVLSKPDVSPVAEAYNVGMENPNAFKNYVIQVGQSYAARGTDISVEQAVQEAVRHLRAVNPSLGINQSAGQVAQTRVVAPNSKPTIPNIQGKGTSPVKSSIRSLDDLRAKAKEFESSAY